MSKITVFHYLYRDGSNYKALQSIVTDGALTEAQIREIHDCLDEGTYFIPEQVGLPPADHLWSAYGVNDDDHPWHELKRVESRELDANQEVFEGHLTADEVYRNFIEAKGNWDEAESSISGYPKWEDESSCPEKS